MPQYNYATRKTTTTTAQRERQRQFVRLEPILTEEQFQSIKLAVATSTDTEHSPSHCLFFTTQS